MRMFGKASLLAAPLMALGLAAAAAQPALPPPPQGDSLGADWREQQNEARATVRAGRHIPLERVIDAIRRRTPGRLLDTGMEAGPDGHAVYRVRWAAATGRRIDFLVDARSGAILSEQGK
jgi:uncharacterized membrane protein YkoI